MQIDLWQGDCLELMKNIPDGSVDLVLTDPPYGTTKCKWDLIIPFDEMWAQLNRVKKKHAPVILFSKQPFTTKLNSSNLKNFKQELIWKKSNHDNPMMAKRKHMNIIENISVFYEGQCNYYPQGLIEVNKKTRQGPPGIISDQRRERPKYYTQTHTNYPKNILDFKSDRGNHPTQKPVALLEYLIKTYTLENETVLDFTMGSGSTGVAAKNLNRNFIGIELDENYYQIAKERINGTKEET